MSLTVLGEQKTKPPPICAPVLEPFPPAPSRRPLQPAAAWKQQYRAGPDDSWGEAHGRNTLLEIPRMERTERRNVRRAPCFYSLWNSIWNVKFCGAAMWSCVADALKIKRFHGEQKDWHVKAAQATGSSLFQLLLCILRTCQTIW